MTVKSAGTWAGLFVTLDATGALSAGTPSGVLYVDGTANGASVTITGSNPYKWSVTLPALTAGQRVDMYITATISTIATASVVASEQADTTILSDGVAVASIANNAITAAAIATDAIDADSIKSDAITEIQAGLATPTNITAGTITTVTNLTNLPAIPNDWLTAAGIKSDAVEEIADGVWDEAISGHTTGTTFGGKNQKVVPSETINDYKADVSALTNVTLAATQTGVTIPTVTAVTNAPTDMAKESTLTAIKGASWTDETLAALMTAIEGISAGSGASVADIMGALLASYTDSGSVGEALGRLDNIQAKTDLITTGTSLTIASAVSGSTITAHRGDTLSAALENIGALTNYSKVWFTVKRDFDDADSAAVVQIEKTGGLLYINGAAGTAGNGSLTINDEASGDVTIVLAAAETAKLGAGSYQYDIQVLRSAGTPVSTLTYGEFIVDADVTKATA